MIQAINPYFQDIQHLGKVMLLVLILPLLSVSCSVDDDDILNPLPFQSLLMIQLDFQSLEVKGITELELEPASTFFLSTVYIEEDDFGLLEIRHYEYSTRLFYGSMRSSGTGERIFPAELDDPAHYNTFSNPMGLPPGFSFSPVIFTLESHYPEHIDYDAIWNAVRNYEIVFDYFTSNPGGKVSILLFKPRTQASASDTWEWYIFWHR